MKCLVIYKSQTGFTEKYAKWIASELSADLKQSREVNKVIFKDYDVVIYGGSLHAVGIRGRKFISKNFDLLRTKKVIVFAVGASPYRKEILDEVREKNFSEEEKKIIHLYYLRGGFNYRKLPFFDKILMKLLQLKLTRKKVLTADEKGMLNAFKQPVDFTRKENIIGLVSYVQSLE